MDPSGKIALIDDAVVVGGVIIVGCSVTPACRNAVSKAVSGAVTDCGKAASRAYNWMFSEEANKDKGEVKDPSPVRDVVVPSDKYPEASGHIEDAQNDGQPDILTIDRNGARGRRSEAMNGQPIVPGKDRDEYPPAMFEEGGKGASVRPISPSDNRGAGACIAAQCRGLPNGSKVRIIPGG